MATEGKNESKRDITYEVVEHLGVLAQYSSGWSKEVNLIKWNGGTPKFDIRDWDKDHEHMSRGITLRADEARKLIDALVKYNNQKVFDYARAAEEEKKQRYSKAPTPYSNNKGHEESLKNIEEKDCNEEEGFIGSGNPLIDDETGELAGDLGI